MLNCTDVELYFTVFKIIFFLFSFLEGSVVDHRDVKLQSVKLRYADEKFYKVSEIQVGVLDIEI